MATLSLSNLRMAENGEFQYNPGTNNARNTYLCYHMIFWVHSVRLLTSDGGQRELTVIVLFYRPPLLLDRVI